MKRVGISSSTLTALDRLSDRWIRVWVQGGEFTRLNSDRPLLTTVLVVETEKCLVSLQSDSIMLDDLVEVFVPSARLVDEIGTTASERGFQPPRMPVDAFPDELELTPLIGVVPAWRIIDEVVWFEYRGIREYVAVEAGILFSASGVSMLVIPDEDAPGCLAISTRPGEIAAQRTGELRFQSQAWGHRTRQ